MDESPIPSPRPLERTSIEATSYRRFRGTPRFSKIVEPPIEVRTRRSGSTLTVELSNDLDLDARGPLRRAFARLVDAPIAVIDLTHVTYADTTLLSAIILLAKRRASCGNTVLPNLIGTSAPLRRLLALTHVDRLVNVEGGY